MTKSARLLVFLLILGLGFGVSLANDRWIHVRVDDLSGDGEMVRVSVPLTMLEVILRNTDAGDFHRGKIHIDDDDFDLDEIDMRAVLKELRNMEDAEFVTVRNRDEHIRVAKEDDVLLIQIDDVRDGDEKTRVTIPLAVAEAFFAGDGEEFDLVAALHTLDEYTGGELVRVESDDERIRVWIDDNNYIEE